MILLLRSGARQPLTSKPNRVGYVNKGGQGERIYSPNGVAITLSANGGGVGHRTGLYLVNGKVRRLHIDEAKAVMGFKKGHVVSDWCVWLSSIRQCSFATYGRHNL